MSIEDSLSPKDPVSEIGYKSFCNLVKDGRISCSWIGYREVYYEYLKNKAKDQKSAIPQTAFTLNKPYNTVYYIVRLFE